MEDQNKKIPGGEDRNSAGLPKSPSIDSDKLVEQHADALYRFALLRTDAADVAEDMVQETFLAAVQGKQSFRMDSSERTWLIGILKHKLLDYFRKRARETLCADDFFAHDSEIGDNFTTMGQWKHPPLPWPETPDKTLERKEFWAVMMKCLKKLSSKMRQAFTLRELEALESEQICKILGVSSTNLHVLMHRSRFQLRQCLEKHWFTAVEKERKNVQL